MTDKLEIIKGQEFGSYEELKKFVEDYQKYSKQRFRKQRSKYLGQAFLKREFKKDLVYYEMEFVCIHGGNFKRRGAGIRETRTRCTNCPCFFKLRASKDGQKLEVKSLNMVHENHDTVEDLSDNKFKIMRVPTTMPLKNKKEIIKESITLKELCNSVSKFNSKAEDSKEEKDLKSLRLSHQNTVTSAFSKKKLRARALKQEFFNAANNSTDESNLDSTSDVEQEGDIKSSLVTENTNNNNKSSMIVECVPDIQLEERVCTESESENLSTVENANLSAGDNKTIVKLKKSFQSVAVQTNSKLYSIDMFRENNNAILFYTGLESYEKFRALYDTLEPDKPPFLHYQGDVTSISKEDQLFLTLMKLKRNTEDYELSLFFGISKTCVFHVLITWINFMHQMWSMSNLWPSEEFIIYYMPKNFKQYYPANKINRDVARITWLNEANNQNAELEEDLDTSVSGNKQLAWEQNYVKKLVDLTKRFNILRKSLKMCYAPLGQKVYEICLMMCNFTEDPRNV